MLKPIPMEPVEPGAMEIVRWGKPHHEKHLLAMVALLAERYPAALETGLRVHLHERSFCRGRNGEFRARSLRGVWKSIAVRTNLPKAEVLMIVAHEWKHALGEMNEGLCAAWGWARALEYIGKVDDEFVVGRSTENAAHAGWSLEALL